MGFTLFFDEVLSIFSDGLYPYLVTELIGFSWLVGDGVGHSRVTPR